MYTLLTSLLQEHLVERAECRQQSSRALVET